jgi:hypothetical protein
VPSLEFTSLESCILELKRIYLGTVPAGPAATPDEQELARAFVLLAHAEFEYYIETALGALEAVVFANGLRGQFSSATLALMSFSNLPSTAGGDKLSPSKSLKARLGEAHSYHVSVVRNNNGVRESYLAKMAVPLGLHRDIVDSTWLNDLDAFCAYRGKYAHLSRVAPGSSFLSVNPADLWSKCSGILWRNTALASPGVIGSFEDFDDWVESQKRTFGTVASGPIRVGVLDSLAQFLQSVWSRILGP